MGRVVKETKGGIPTAEYHRIHKYLVYNFKKIKKCEICGSTEKKAYHFALKKGFEHCKNRENYIVLCVSCHVKYDMTDERRANLSRIKKIEVAMGFIPFGFSLLGKYGKDHIRSKPVVRLDLVTLEFIERYDSLSCAERKHNFKTYNTSNCALGKTKSSYGFKWVFENEYIKSLQQQSDKTASK